MIRQVGVEILAELLRRLDPAGVGGDHDQVVAGKPELVLQVGGDQRQRGEVVEGTVEVALDLAGVQVDRHDPVGARDPQHVGDQFRADRLARQRLLVLPGVAVVRHDRGDALGARALHRVDDDDLLHDRLVDRLEVRLHDEDVGAADRLIGPEVDLT